MSKSFDLYEAVTARIIDQLEQGTIPWRKPWTGVQGGAYSGTTGKPYSLMNQMLLSVPGPYFTFNEISKRGGSIRKGEKANLIVFWKILPVLDETDEGEEPKTKAIPFLRYYNVWHIDQCEGLTAEAPQEPTEAPQGHVADVVIADYLSRENLTMLHQKGDRAYYSPSLDRVLLPLLEQFADAAEYYSTAFHELTHSTGHSSRLDRIKATAHFGSADYSREELVAEIGAAALMNYTGVETPSTFRNNAAYVQGWLRALKNDRRLIVAASGAAEKAVRYILGE